MVRRSRIFAAAGIAAVLVAGALLAGRALRRAPALPAGVATLTPLPGSAGFEPTTMPGGPVLRNEAPGGLKVAFGYGSGGVAYAYTLALDFAPGAAEGRATLAVAHGGHTASTETRAVRRWDAPRKAFAVALSDKFMIAPPVPALCVKAVVGPTLASLDLTAATLCVARRDSGGACLPATLACGLLRP